eukprot:265838_1
MAEVRWPPTHTIENSNVPVIDPNVVKNAKDALASCSENSMSSIPMSSSDDSDNETLDYVTLNDITRAKSITAIVEFESSDSDDYHSHNQYNDDNDLKEKCAAIRQDIAENYIKFKWKKLFTNRLFCSRISTSILAILLLGVSTAYCIGQTCRTELDLITPCNEPKTRKEIWEHSAEISLKSADPGAMTPETYYGWTDDSCWTTKRSEINERTLWYSNKYTYQWVQQPINVKMVLFALTSLYCALIIAYTVKETLEDIICIHRNILHKKSSLYIYQGMHNNTNRISHTAGAKGEGIWLNCFRNMRAWYKANAAADTSFWIAMMFANEFIEILLQSQALLLYNGYHLFDPNHQNDIYLANKPEFIITFAVILAFNCFGSALCWLLYALVPGKCRGLTFKLALFYVDEISDLFYATFPFVIIFGDTYNQTPDDIWIAMAQLHITSDLSFVAAFIPLLLLCNKCLFISINSIRKMRDQYYNHWQFIQSVRSQCDSTVIAYQAQLRGHKTQTSFMNGINQKEIYDSKGNIQLNVRSDSRTIKRDNMNRIKKAALVFLSCAYVVIGILVLFYTITYIKESQAHCAQIDESRYFTKDGTFRNNTIDALERGLFKRNPELFLWNQCLYQVYPFAAKDEHKCQCRVFVIEWRSDHVYSKLRSTGQDRHRHLNLTQAQLLDGIIRNWYMLEKFSTQGAEGDISSTELYVFGSDMYNKRKMKAFSWISIPVQGMYEGISAWSDLEYFHIQNTNNIQSLPSDFVELRSLKFFRSTLGGLVGFPKQLCALTALRILQIEWDVIPSVPHCVAEKLRHLQHFLLNGCVGLSTLPISLFALPHLLELSLWHQSVAFEDVLSFNNITNTSKQSLEIYFERNFEWNEDATYYLSLNPICDNQNRSELPTKLQTFLNRFDTCNYPCEKADHEDLLIRGQNAYHEGLYRYCPPNIIGDGKCDFSCNNPSCFVDFGDCQQLCFAEEFSNCTWDLLSNDKCDAECDNDYCRWDNWQYSFEEGMFGKTDNGKCAVEQDADNLNGTELQYIRQCWASVDENIYTNETCGHLRWFHWIGDGVCDDACRIEACFNDRGDCEKGCQNIQDDTCAQIYNIWSYAPVLDSDVGDGILARPDKLCALWPLAAQVLKLPPGANCTNLVRNAELNHDGRLNFREFVIMVLNYTGDPIEKVMQVNCSACVGVDEYNAMY